MKEFMLLIRNSSNSKAHFSTDENNSFLKACEVYIEELKKNGNLISAQPLVRDGKMLSGTSGNWHEAPYATTSEVIVGYYHIKADDLNHAINIAKGNPEFSYTNTARIEVRPVKTREDATGYVYPENK